MSWLKQLLSITIILQFTLQPVLAAEVPKIPPVETEAITRHIRFLASDELQGRRSGTEGCVKAGEYIANEFKRLGLKPFGTDYYQHFDFISGLKVDKSSFKVKTGGRKTELKLGTDYQPLNFSSSINYKGEMMLTGFGIKADKLNYNDFQGMNLRQKAVLILPYSPEGNNVHGKFAEYLSIRRKTLSAREQGASLALFISEAENLSTSPARGEDANFTDAGIAAVTISRKTADLILAQLGKTVEQLVQDGEKNAKGTISTLEKTKIELELKLTRQTQKTSNVIGVIEGSSLKNEYVVIGAHYDHLGLGGSSSLAPDRKGIHYGADDNASGVAGLLELARIFSISRAQRSIIFAAFSGEEEGLLGSAHYVKSPLVPIENTIAMLNMDMIGRMRDDKLVIGGMGTSPAWKAIVEEANRTRGLVLTYQDDGYGPSDHASFYARDLPVLFFFTGNHEDYHKPSDTYDKINVINTQTIVTLVRDIILRVANGEKRPQFTRATASDTRRVGNTGFRVVLGTVPDYAAQVEGMKLSGVRPGSPAEKAGFQAGDILVELAGRKITSVYDYTYVLQELKPNQAVNAVVTRDGKRLELTVTPMPR